MNSDMKTSDFGSYSGEDEYYDDDDCSGSSYEMATDEDSWSDNVGYDYGGEPEFDNAEDEEEDFPMLDEAANKGVTEELPSKSYSFSELADHQQSKILEVSSLFSLHTDMTELLLRRYRWKNERLIEDYMDDRERTFAKLEIPGPAAGAVTNEAELAKPSPEVTFSVLRPPPSGGSNNNNNHNENTGSAGGCGICMEEWSDDNPGFQLPCHHAFCRNCWAEYLCLKFVEENENWTICCAAFRCSQPVATKHNIQMLIDVNPDDNIATKLRRLFLRAQVWNYIKDNRHATLCPVSEDCNTVVECNEYNSVAELLIPIVSCSNHHTFCMRCEVAGTHLPCPCHLARGWREKCVNDSETVNYIAAHTKECPNCKETIEKNGGCNHMTCAKCQHHWCWICMGPWKEHGNEYYNCTRYDKNKEKNIRSDTSAKRRELERYLHYNNHFTTHEQSIRNTDRLHHYIKRKIQEVQRSEDVSFRECQFLSDAVDVLRMCRQTLMWTFVLAYYMIRADDDHQATIFENNQVNLNYHVEELADMIENTKPEELFGLRMEIMTKIGYVRARRETLLKDTLEGLSKGWWEFNEPAKSEFSSGGVVRSDDAGNMLISSSSIATTTTTTTTGENRGTSNSPASSR